MADLVPGAGGVVVDVQAAGINYPDLLVISGRYQLVPPLPFVPGKEAAGVVRSVGAGVTRLRPGDRVLAHVEHGAYATQLAVAESQCQPLPPEIAADVAVATLGLPAQTAWFALFERARLQPGELVLINGATGAVGQAAVQIARACGAVVLAGVNSAARAQWLRDAGVSHIIDLGAPRLRDSLRTEVHAATAGRGVDVVIDCLGGDVFDASLRALAWCGRIVVVGFAAGRIPEVKANYLLVKNISASGLQWSDYRDREPWKVAKAHAQLCGLVQRGALVPGNVQKFRLEEFGTALELLGIRRASGRLVLDMVAEQT
ncbi:MAG TPA: NADPH:quinone oxidoreductase family protein [Ramlibacter sp.]|nr:NADPH:quinone oxidoreductase family protein [Ramlibacter sp.]